MGDEHEYMWEAERRVERTRARAKAKIAKVARPFSDKPWWKRLFGYRIRIVIERRW